VSAILRFTTSISTVMRQRIGGGDDENSHLEKERHHVTWARASLGSQFGARIAMPSLNLTNLIPAIPICVMCLILAIGFAWELTSGGEQ
jgi:hypothetical protein